MFLAVVLKCLAFSANDLSEVKITPPLPQVIVLLPLKLNMPALEKVPRCFFLYFEPIDSAASSIKIKLYFLQIFLNLKSCRKIHKDELRLMPKYIFWFLD